MPENQVNFPADAKCSEGGTFRGHAEFHFLAAGRNCTIHVTLKKFNQARGGHVLEVTAAHAGLQRQRRQLIRRNLRWIQVHAISLELNVRGQIFRSELF